MLDSGMSLGCAHKSDSVIKVTPQLPVTFQGPHAFPRFLCGQVGS